MPFQAPRTSFNTELTPHRRFAYASVPLDDVREIKDAFDVKLNDVVLALCAGTLRRYLESTRRAPRLAAHRPGAGVAAHRRRPRTTVGTKVGAMFASLATDIADPGLRLLAIHDSTQGAKEMQQALAAEKIMGITETAPAGLISLAAACTRRPARHAHAADHEPHHLERRCRWPAGPGAERRGRSQEDERGEHDGPSSWCNLRIRQNTNVRDPASAAPTAGAGRG